MEGALSSTPFIQPSSDSRCCIERSDHEVTAKCVKMSRALLKLCRQNTLGRDYTLKWMVEMQTVVQRKIRTALKDKHKRLWQKENNIIS